MADINIFQVAIVLLLLLIMLLPIIISVFLSKKLEKSNAKNFFIFKTFFYLIAWIMALYSPFMIPTLYVSFFVQPIVTLYLLLDKNEELKKFKKISLLLILFESLMVIIAVFIYILSLLLTI